MEDIEKFIVQFNDIDMDNSFIVELLAEDFGRWLRWIKTYGIKFDVLTPKEFDAVVVVHNCEEQLKIEDSWSFLEDVKYYLTEYVNCEMDDEELHDEYYCDVVDFWSYPLQKLLKN